MDFSGTGIDGHLNNNYIIFVVLSSACINIMSQVACWCTK